CNRCVRRRARLRRRRQLLAQGVFCRVRRIDRVWRRISRRHVWRLTMDELVRPLGFEVPLRRSLTEPILIAGLPRRITLVLWTAGFALALGLREPWVLLPAGIAHWACAVATKHEPQFIEVFFKAYHNPRRLEP